MLDTVSEERQNQITEGLFFHKRSATKIQTTMVMEDCTFYYRIQAAYHPVPQIAFTYFDYI